MTKPSDAIAAYIKLRDKKTEIERKQKEELAPIKDAMAKIEGWLQRHLLEEGGESLKTEFGTAFLQTATSATVRDWNATLDYIKDKDEWSLLEARVNKTAVKDFIASTGDAPPGVEFNETIVTRVRR